MLNQTQTDPQVRYWDGWIDAIHYALERCPDLSEQQRDWLLQDVEQADARRRVNERWADEDLDRGEHSTERRTA